MFNALVYDTGVRPSMELTCFAVLRALSAHLKRFEEVIDRSVDFENAEVQEIHSMPKLLSAYKWAYGVEKFSMETYARFIGMKVTPTCAKFYEALSETYQRAFGKVSG